MLRNKILRLTHFSFIESEKKDEIMFRNILKINIKSKKVVKVLRCLKVSFNKKNIRQMFTILEQFQFHKNIVCICAILFFFLHYIYPHQFIQLKEKLIKMIGRYISSFWFWNLFPLQIPKNGWSNIKLCFFFLPSLKGYFDNLSMLLRLSKCWMASFY